MSNWTELPNRFTTGTHATSAGMALYVNADGFPSYNPDVSGLIGPSYDGVRRLRVFLTQDSQGVEHSETAEELLALVS